MATLSQAESRRLYSWWWDSHISPKNSKWLQDNLSDMDSKIRTMIRLIEQDADSFAQRAEMYYEKRPQLMKLVEEFYRAYRALAERYDHTTGALRQAHRTIAEAFPNQIPLELCDESLYESSGSDSGMSNYEMPQGTFNPDVLLQKLLGLTLHDEATKPNEVKPYESCLKQFDEMCVAREDAASTNPSGGKEGKFSEYKLLQKEISRLSKENQDLKKQICSESMRADKNENDIQHLKETCSKAKYDKEDALARYEESMARVSYLEDEISRTKAEIKKLNDEMIVESSCLKSGEGQSLLLKSNQSLQLELDILKQKIKEQQQKLNKKVQELEILNISLENENLRNLKAEMAFQSLEKQRTEVEEEMGNLKLHIKNGVEKLKDVEEELQKIREENARLNEQKLSSTQKIMNLQDEIISMMDLKRKFEDEVDLHIEEKESLQLELCRLTNERNDLEQKQLALVQEIREVNLKVESLQALIKDLEGRECALKDTIKKYEDEKALYLENLNHMQAVSEKNAVLEASLVDANGELERLRVKIKELEDSSDHLRCRMSIHLAEKAALISQMDASTQNMEKQFTRNAFLEKSLSDMSLEVEGLKAKLKGLEESCKSFRNENSCLLYEKSALISQVESIKNNLENLEERYHELEDKNLNLEREKDSMLYHVAELQELLKTEKEEHGILIQSSKSHLSTLANQIFLLQEECRQREKEFDVEQHKVLTAQIEIFILQRCLCEMKEENSILANKSYEHQEALRCAEKRIQELQSECLNQDKKIKSVIEHNEKLREWIHLVTKSLKIDLQFISLDDIKDDILLQIALREIGQMLHTISEVQDEKQHLLLEKSVVVTLLEQFGKYVTDLKEEKTALDGESKIRLQEITFLRNNNDEFLEMNRHLRKEMDASKQREEALKAEVDLLFRQITYLQGAYNTLQTEVGNMLEENNVMSRKLDEFSHVKVKLEEENDVLLTDVIALEYLSLMLRSLDSERAHELQLLSNEREDLYMVKHKLKEEIELLRRKIEVLELENSHLKESSTNLNECRNLLSMQHDLENSRIARSGNPLMEKDMYFSQANVSMKRSQDVNPAMCRNLNDLKSYIYEAESREELEKEFFIFLEDCTCNENEIEFLHQANNAWKGQLRILQKDVEDFGSGHENSNSAIQRREDEFQPSDALITSLLQNILFETINASVLKEKVLELIRTCKNFESSVMVQREVAEEEIALRNLTLNQLDEKIQLLEGENNELRADLTAYSLFLGSLWDDIFILEELTLSLVKRHSTSTCQKEEVETYSSTASNQEMSIDYNARTPTGILKLQCLHDKIKELQEVMINTGSVMEIERYDSNANLEAAWKEVEGLKSKRKSDSKTTRSNYKQIMKDIQFDIVLNSSGYGNGIVSHGLPKTVGNTDQMMGLWGIAEGYGNQKQKTPLVTENDITHYQTDEEEDKCTSDASLVEKELSVDRPELPRSNVPHQQWNRRVIQRLVSDAHRLFVLQANLQELQKSIEKSEKINHPSRPELSVIRVQLQEFEGSISELIDVNSRLKSKVDELCASPLNLVEEKDIWSKRQKQISDWAKKVAEKIARLELEMPKIQYTLLRFDEEHTDKRSRVRRRSGIRLREYIYGRRNSRRQKDDSCGCMRAAATSD